ncbi:MAG: fatty acid--CoA ligase [Granulosicoccus sp.]|nr:fatty acid--CoA ligase [Granulosicoccus sp.]
MKTRTIADSAYSYPLLIKQLLHTPLLCTPSQEIVSAGTQRYDYTAFFKRIGRVAAALRSIGVADGDTVAVMDWDCHRYLECFFAVPMMQAVLHTVNVRLSPEQILYTINHAQDDVILVHQEFLSLFEQIADRIERPVKLILLQDEVSEQPLPENFIGEYESMLEQVDEDFGFRDFDENSLATLFYTTGTTGNPKGVAFSHRQLVLHTMGLLAGLGPLAGSCSFNKNDVYMPITPMFHVHGWGIPFAATLAGIKQVYPGRYDPSTLLRLIEEEGVTFSHCVPTILHMLLNAPESKSVDLSGWKVIIGGSALSRGLANAALDRGIEVFTGYGMSETCPVLTIADVADSAESSERDFTLSERCVTGTPLPMVDLRVVDGEMNDVPHDGSTTGEVVARAPWTTLGYVDNQKNSDELWRGGYLHTGDVGHINESGVLQITDRLKDVIKSGGEWISSLDLEDAISRCPGVSEVAAIGVPDARWGERPVVLVVTSDGIDLETSDVQQAIATQVESGRFSKWAIPERVEFVDSLPKTSVGKLDKKKMRALYAD